MKRIVIFHPFLGVAGGSERITLEEEKYLNANHIQAIIVTFEYKNIFNGSYRPNVRIIKTSNHFWLFKIISRIIQLRKIIKEIKPDAIDVCNIEGCLYMYISTFLTQFKYFTQLPSSGYDNIDSYGENLITYALGAKIFIPGYNKIRVSTPGHIKNLPEKWHQMKLFKQTFSNILGYITYRAVRKAVRKYVLSNQVKWEIEQLYDKDSIVLRGAYPNSIIGYKPRFNIKDSLNINNKKVILSLCRLAPKKRVEWIIKAFNILVNEGEKDSVLIIGSTGPSEEDLKLLVK